MGVTYKTEMNNLPIIGRQGCTPTHFGEEYHVLLEDRREVLVYVWTPIGKREKQNHAKAGRMAKKHFNCKVRMVTYC